MNVISRKLSAIEIALYNYNWTEKARERADFVLLRETWSGCVCFRETYPKLSVIVCCPRVLCKSENPASSFLNTLLR